MFLLLIQRRNYSIKLIEENINKLDKISHVKYIKYKDILDNKFIREEVVEDDIETILNLLENINGENYDKINEILLKKKEKSIAEQFGIGFGLLAIFHGSVLYIANVYF